MNLQLFGRVIRRFKYLIAGGLVIAVVLSAMTVVKLPSLAPRTPPQYASSEELFVTQSRFPWGSAIQQYTPAGNGGGTTLSGDLGRLTGLANLYVQLANSDVLKGLLAKQGIKDKITASQNYSFSPSLYSSALPIITLTGTAPSAAKAVAVTQAGGQALTDYLKRQQAKAGIDQADRVVMQLIQTPKKPVVVNGPKKTLPVVVFMTVMLAVVGLAFVLENLRPQVREPGLAEVRTEPMVAGARRSA